MESNRKTVGKCPMCGADVVKTIRGYRCSNALGCAPTCKFEFYAQMYGRRLTDAEAADLMADRRLLVHGLISKDEGKEYTSILRINAEGKVGIDSKVGTCPRCGGEVHINSRGFSCRNYRKDDHEHSCHFMIWHNIGGHDITLNEVEEIITMGATSNPVEVYTSQGEASMRRIGFTDNTQFSPVILS